MITRMFVAAALLLSLATPQRALADLTVVWGTNNGVGVASDAYLYVTGAVNALKYSPGNSFREKQLNNRFPNSCQGIANFLSWSEYVTTRGYVPPTYIRTHYF